MTHPNESSHESTPFDLMIQVLDQHGFDGMARAIGILVNEAMKIERSEAARSPALPTDGPPTRLCQRL